MIRSLVVLLGLAHVGCGFDASGLGEGGGEGGGGSSTGETTHAEPGDTTTTTTAGTEHGSGASSGLPTDDGSTFAVGDATTSTDDTATTQGSTTGDDVPVLPCTPGQPELAACYDFVEVGSGMLWDRSGNGNDAPALAIGVVPGPFGEAATFDHDSQISVPDSASLDLTGPLTLEAWILVDALPGSGRVGVLDNDGQYGMMIHADDQYRCAVSGVTVFMGPVVLGQWSHFACVLDGAFLRLYVDGTELASTPASGPANTGNGNPMSIGDTSPDFTEPLTGAVGGVRIWSTALDPEALCEAAGDACSA